MKLFVIASILLISLSVQIAIDREDVECSFTSLDDFEAYITKASCTKISINLLLSTSSLAKLASLTGYTNAKEFSLYAQESRITDITPLSKISTLTLLEKFSIHFIQKEEKFSDISALDALKSLTNLKIIEINFDENLIQDIEVFKLLKQLTKLTTVSISLINNAITSLTVFQNIATLPELTTLSLNFKGNKIVDISFLSSIKTIPKLNSFIFNVEKNQIVDISPLKLVKTIAAVEITICSNSYTCTDITWCQIKDMPTFIDQNKQCFCISNCIDCKTSIDICDKCKASFFFDNSLKICDKCMDHCADCSKKEVCITCDNGYIFDADKAQCVSTATDCKFTSLNDMASYANKADCLKLSIMAQYSNDLTKLNTLAGFTNVKEFSLTVWDSAITNISPLANIKDLTQLKKLSIYLTSKNDKFSDLSSLDALKALIKLINIEITFDNNSIENIDAFKFLKELPDIQTISLSLNKNQIKDISVFSNLKDLKGLTTLELSLKENAISDISVVADLKSITKLATLKFDVEANLIYKLSPFKQLIGIQNTNINFCNNKYTCATNWCILKNDIQRFFDENKQCLCMANCVDCTTSVDTCDKCLSKFFYDGTEKKCSQCIDHCNLCQDKTTCQTCEDNYVYDDTKKECVLCKNNKDCPNGQFCNAASKCEVCQIEKCLECQDNNLCLNCEAKLVFRTEEKKCVEFCQSNEYTVNKKCEKCVEIAKNCIKCKQSKECTTCFANPLYQQCQSCYRQCSSCYNQDSCVRCINQYEWSSNKCNTAGFLLKQSFVLLLILFLFLKF